jgi:hypothetical protein
MWGPPPRRRWGPRPWGPRPLWGPGVVVVGGPGYYDRRGYYPPGPQYAVAQPPRLRVTFHCGAGIVDRGWTGGQDVQCVVFAYYGGEPFSSGKSGLAQRGGGDPVWTYGNSVSLHLPREAAVEAVSLNVQVRCANTFLSDAEVGMCALERIHQIADGNPRELPVAPHGTLTVSVQWIPADVPAQRAPPAPYAAPHYASPPPVPAYGSPPPVRAVPAGAEPELASAVYVDDHPPKKADGQLS